MAYTRVNWEDLPSTNTPRNATNLNKMDAGIKENDDKLNGTKPMGSIIVDDIKCKNLFNKDSWIKSYINPSTGVIVTSYNAALFDYIEVNSLTNYSTSLSTTVTDYRISYYTSNLSWISSSSSSTSNNTFTTPSNCAYVRIYINVDGNGIDQTKIDSLNFQFRKKIENEEVYSEDEIRIGTWIDKKPLYRKVFTITSLTSSNTNLVDVSNLSIDYAKISGTIITSTGAKFPINLYDSASNYSVIILSDAGYIRGRGAIGSGTLSKCIVILEYTKTTSGTRMLNIVDEGEEENR